MVEPVTVEAPNQASEAELIALVRAKLGGAWIKNIVQITPRTDPLDFDVELQQDSLSAQDIRKIEHHGLKILQTLDSKRVMWVRIKSELPSKNTTVEPLPDTVTQQLPKVASVEVAPPEPSEDAAFMAQFAPLYERYKSLDPVQQRDDFNAIVAAIKALQQPAPERDDELLARIEADAKRMRAERQALDRQLESVEGDNLNLRHANEIQSGIINDQEREIEQLREQVRMLSLTNGHQSNWLREAVPNAVKPQKMKIRKAAPLNEVVAQQAVDEGWRVLHMWGNGDELCAWYLVPVEPARSETVATESKVEVKTIASTVMMPRPVGVPEMVGG